MTRYHYSHGNLMPDRLLSPALLLSACLLTPAGWASQPLPIERPAEAPLRVTEAEPLFDLARSVQQVSPQSFRLRFHATDLIKAGQTPRPLVGDISRVDGKWVAGTGNTPGYNQALHTIDITEGKADQTHIKATLKATIKPDNWVPADKKTREVTFELDLKLIPAERAPGSNEDAEPSTEGQFWRVFPNSDQPTLKVEGTYRVIESPYEADAAEPSTGQVTGTLSVPIAPNRWNMGTLNEAADGVRLRLDMGTTRGNWNHARLTQMGFEPARDLSAWHGLRISIDTDKPRDDANIAVWLREDDGSWYYVKYAVPLADEQNQAVLLFEDFSEAEWVSPTNHMDEDYVLDRSGVAVIGIGIVNALGVGEVGFEIKGVELVRVDRPAPTPAVARVTGKLLSVSGHELVPPGIFGGYAPEIPEHFRPGSQRHLWAGAYPRIPDQHRLRLAADDITDNTKLASILRNADDPRVAQLRSHLDPKADKRFLELLNSAKPDDDADKHKRALVEGLNKLLRKPDMLYKPDAWQGTKFAGELADLRDKAADGSINDTQSMRLNRDLLALLAPGSVKPAPEGDAVEAFYLDCVGERKEPAYLLSNPNWEQHLTNLGKSFARRAADNNYVAHFEFWNEPYLNWAERSRVNYNLKFYNTAAAGEGQPVQVRYNNGTLGPVIPHLAWRKDAKDQWQVYDPTAFTFWSGRGNGWVYDQMLGVVARAIKEENPATRVIAGWGFRWNEDHWAAWDLLYKPTIDRNIQYIDAIHEHHYQGDTTAMNGSYEVLTAYSVTAHDKWLYSYNTETNDLVDAPARGGVDTPQKADNAKNFRRMTYNLRDMLYCVYQSPDKAVARSLIHWDQTREGSTICLDMLKNLRGRLIETQSPDPDVWVVASVDGTDPQALAPGYNPEKDPQHLVVFVFNNHRQPRDVGLEIAAPTGTMLGDAYIETVTLDPQTFALNYTTDTLTRPASDSPFQQTLQLAQRSVWKITFTMHGRVGETAEVARDQFFSPDILQAVTRGAPLTTAVKLDKEKLTSAKRAWLRLVVEDIERGEAAVAVAGKTYPVPHAIMGDNNNRIVQIPLDRDTLTEEPELTFTVTPGNFAGYRVDMASIVLEQR